MPWRKSKLKKETESSLKEKMATISTSLLKALLIASRRSQASNNISKPIKRGKPLENSPSCTTLREQQPLFQKKKANYMLSIELPLVKLWRQPLWRRDNSTKKFWKKCRFSHSSANERKNNCTMSFMEKNMSLMNTSSGKEKQGMSFTLWSMEC